MQAEIFFQEAMLLKKSESVRYFVCCTVSLFNFIRQTEIKCCMRLEGWRKFQMSVFATSLYNIELVNLSYKHRFYLIQKISQSYPIEKISKSNRENWKLKFVSPFQHLVWPRTTSRNGISLLSIIFPSYLSFLCLSLSFFLYMLAQVFSLMFHKAMLPFNVFYLVFA